MGHVSRVRAEDADKAKNVDELNVALPQLTAPRTRPRLTMDVPPGPRFWFRPVWKSLETRQS